MTTTSTRLMTADELLARSSELGRCELIRGELITMSPAGADHGEISLNLAFFITGHVRRHALGKVYSAETGFVLDRNPDTVREADVGFVRASRVPKGPTPGFFSGAPDLAVEVLSPNDRASEVAEKVDMWLRHGCVEVWVVDPRRKTVTVHRGMDYRQTLESHQAIDGGSLLPGLQIKVADIFA